MKIAINCRIGGFGLSDLALKKIIERKDSEFDKEDAQWFFRKSENRNDPDLIAVIEELGEEADGEYAQLKIVEIPDDVEWIIDEQVGREWVAEAHRRWF